MSRARLFGTVASALVRGTSQRFASSSAHVGVATRYGLATGVKLQFNAASVMQTSAAVTVNANTAVTRPNFPPAAVQSAMYSTQISSVSPSTLSEVEAALTTAAASEEDDDARARIAFLTETGKQEGQSSGSSQAGKSSSSKRTVRSAKLANAMKVSLDSELQKSDVLANTGKDYNILQPGFDKLIPEATRDPVLAKDLTSVFEFTSLRTGSASEMRKARIKAIIEHYQRREGDTGSSEVQIAVLTERIGAIEEHLRMHHKDVAVKRDFGILIHRRRKLLNYLRRQRFRTYQVLVRDLNIDEEAMATFGRLPTNRPFLPTPGRDPNRHAKLKRKSRRA